MKKTEYIFLIVLIVLLFFVLYFQNTFADEDSQIKIGQLDIEISVQKGVMIDAEKQIKIAKENLRLVKKTEGKSWEFIPSIKAAQEELDLAVQKAKDERVKWLDLLKQKSDEIKNSKLEKVENVTSYTVGKKIILIQLSDKCINAVNNNFNTTCPSYKELRFLDTSLEKISGKLFFNGTRGKSQLEDSWRYYDHDPTPRIIVNPPGEMADRYPIIRIESNFDTYLQGGSYTMQEYVLENKTKINDAWGNNGTYQKVKSIIPLEKAGTTTIYHDRFVNKSCKYAIINSDKGMELLLDTIKYLQSSCTETNFDNKEVIIKNYTVQKIETTQKYKEEKWLKSISKSKNSTNTSVTEDKMPKYQPKVHPPFEYPSP